MTALLCEHPRPGGATRSEPIDVRFICATNRDLDAEIRSSRFRADFYYP
jgi:transcriptional regulator with GAF, ATPase, and Fis domain